MLAIRSSNVIEYSAVTDAITGDPVSDATVSCVVVDKFGEEVATLDLDPVDGSPGTYRGVLSVEDGEELVRGNVYQIETTVIVGSNTSVDEQSIVADLT